MKASKELIDELKTVCNEIGAAREAVQLAGMYGMIRLNQCLLSADEKLGRIINEAEREVRKDNPKEGAWQWQEKKDSVWCNLCQSLTVLDGGVCPRCGNGGL